MDNLIASSSSDKKINTSNINCPYIKKAFECAHNNITGMSIREFINVSGFPIDQFMVDNFYHNLDDDIPIYVNNELIEWCGFGSKDFNFNKREFNRLLKNYVEKENYWIYSNKEYEEYYKKLDCQTWQSNKSDIKEDVRNINYPEPKLFKVKGKHTTKHMILTVECFKMILMSLSTPKAFDIKKYYLALEKLIKIYSKYQYIQEKKQNEILKIANKDLNKKLDNQSKQLELILQKNTDISNKLTTVQERLSYSNIERAPRTVSIYKRETFLIVKLNKPTDPREYYVIRAQKSGSNNTLNKIRGKFPQSTICIEFNYQPNAVNLHNLIKEKLCKNEQKIICERNYINLVQGYTHAEFVNRVIAINSERALM